HPVPREIGRPVTYDAGHLARRTIRVEVEEIQKADLGRKYARKDKRPLDPPPVVVCRFFELVDRDNGSPPVEVDVDPDEMMLGVVCQVDLFPVPSEFERSPEKFDGSSAQTSKKTLPPIRTGGQVALPSIHAAHTFPSLFDSTLPTAPPPFFAPPPLSSLQITPPAPARPPAYSNDPDIVGWFSDFPIHESSCCTVMLAGATFMEAAIIDYKGKRTAVFVFSDLAVKIEGTFVLRYRAFNIFSERSILPRLPGLAECYGGAFRIYSTKEFPGLKASTELTKARHLALYGVRVNIREQPRKRRK
ncbi:hypothetical protein FKP32DRAFT_1555448, partial [Trametes sanguinea]